MQFIISAARFAASRRGRIPISRAAALPREAPASPARRSAFRDISCRWLSVEPLVAASAQGDITPSHDVPALADRALDARARLSRSRMIDTARIWLLRARYRRWPLQQIPTPTRLD